ncbi:MAG: hypothetical protein IT359_17055 [Gemmatimonadaceae bacterium]|nr:hypothetical protein [Gemmatimonadaceae bacterium]
MPFTPRVTALSIAIVALAHASAPAHALPLGDAPCLTSDGKPLPLIERPAAQGAGPLVLLLTGDGGWANADQQVADALVARGASVVGLNMRAYLSTRRTPVDAAHDVGCVANHYLAAWHRTRLVVLGYSRGADIVPFVVARWPDALRRKVDMVALVSMSTSANFQFHFIDMVRDVKRDDDVPVAPEVTQLRGLTVICVYGDGDKDTGCTKVDTTIARPYVRRGGHRLTDGFDAIASLLAPALSPVPAGDAKR